MAETDTWAQRWLGPATAVLRHLFSRSVFLIMTPAIIGSHIWLYRRISSGAPDFALLGMTLTDWSLLLALTAMAVLVHELGHLAAYRRFWEAPGPLLLRLGGSVLNPLAEVTYAWRLPRRQRLVVDLGGAWLQLSFAAVLVVLYRVVHSPGIPLAVFLSEFGLLLSLLPLPGRDGAWIFRDLAGLQGSGASKTRAGQGLRIARGYQAVATGFFILSQVMAIVLGVALVEAVGRLGPQPSTIPVAVLLLALGWLELRLFSLIMSLLAALWIKRRGAVHARRV